MHPHKSELSDLQKLVTGDIGVHRVADGMDWRFLVCVNARLMDAWCISC